jgi:phosphoserine phosphatase
VSRPGLRLVTLDLDGTLLPRDTAFGAILRGNGQGAIADEVDAAYRAGRMDGAACYAALWELVRGLTLADCHRALRRAAWLPGIAEGVQRLRSAGLQVALLTDQPSTVADFLARWGLEQAIASPAQVRDGKVLRLDARLDKLANLRAWLEPHGIALAEVAHVGNGPNDVPVWQAGALGVACFAPPEVARHAHLALPEPSGLPEVAEALLAYAERSSR